MSANFVQLGSVAEFINGAAFKPEDWNGSGAQIIRIQNLTDPNKPYNRTNRTVDDKLRVRPGELLVSWSATLGVFEWMGPEDGVLNQHIFRVVPDKNKVAKNYLRHALEGALVEMQRHLHGATMQHVNRGEFLATKLFLPPLAEQRRIAEVLDRAEALRAKRRAALAKLDTLAQSIFIDVFGDPVTNPKGWVRQTLGEISEKITDGEHLNPKFSQSGMPIVMAGNVLDDRIDLENCKMVESSLGESFRRKCDPIAGDLLVVSRGATIGRLCLVGTCRPFCMMGSVILVKPTKGLIDSRFLSVFLKHPVTQNHLYKTSGSSAQQAMYIKDLRKLLCIVPPLSLQRTFAQHTDAVDKLKATHRLSLVELDALFAVLQHRAFRGGL